MKKLICIFMLFTVYSYGQISQTKINNISGTGTIDTAIIATVKSLLAKTDTNARIATHNYVLTHAGGTVDTSVLASKSYVGNEFLRKYDTSNTLRKSDTSWIATQSWVLSKNYGQGGTTSDTSYHHTEWTKINIIKASSKDSSFVAPNPTYAKTGVPIKYYYGGTAYYGIITSVTGSTIGFCGAKVSPDSVFLGETDRVKQVTFVFLDYWQNYPGNATAGFDSLCYQHNGYQFKWNYANSYLVRYQLFSATNNSSTHAKIAIKKGTTKMTNDLGISSSDATWVSSTVSYIRSDYSIVFDDVIDFYVTKGDDNLPKNLTINLTFVME